MASSQEKMENTFMLEHIRYSLLMELEKRVEKHLKDQFYQRILPAIIKQVKNEVVLDLVSGEDFLDIKIALKNQNPGGK